MLKRVKNLFASFNSQAVAAFVKKRYKLLTALLLLLIIAPLAYLYSRSPQAAQAEWFNDHWQYRKRYPITYTGSETLTEYQVLIDGLDTTTLISNSKLQSDCDDLRFTSTNGQLLSYSIVGNTCNTSDTKVWVQTRKIDADNSQIYMYYGNPSAPEGQNEKETFSYSQEKTVGYILHDSVNDLQVISLAEGNSISHNGTTLSLDKYETGSFSSTATNSAITAKKLFNADDSSGNTDLFVPISWTGTEFYFESRSTSTDTYHLIAPWQDATVTIYDDGTDTGCGASVISSGTTITCDTSDNANVRISSNNPVLLFADPAGSADPMPIHPATSQKWLGGGSGTLVINGNSTLDYRYIYNTAGSEQDPADSSANSIDGLSGDGSFGGGALLIRSANSNYEYGVHQLADGDGSDSHYYNDITEQGTIFGSANQADYISIASTQEATCTIYEQNGTQLDSQTLTSSNTSIYHHGFNTGSSTTYTSGAWYMECDKPVVTHYQKSAGEDESNLMHYPMMRQYTYPTPSVGSPDAEETSPGPVAYWKFDEGHGTTAQDSTSNNLDGSMESSGIEWKPEDMCISGKCLYFDGTTNNGITVNGAPTFTPSDNWTVSFWTKPEDQAWNNVITLKDKDEYSIISRHTNDKPLFYHTTGDNISGNSINFDNSWKHVVLIKSGTTLKWYVNGNLNSSSSNVNFGGINTDSSWLIGFNYSNSYKGFLDELKVYPYARSADEIKTDYQQGAVVLGIQDTQYLSEGLVGYWKLDESPSATASATDSSGNNNDGTATETLSQAGKFGNSRYFGGDNDYINLTDSFFGNKFTDSDDFTLSAWVNPSSLPSESTTFIGQRYGDTMVFGMRSSGNLYLNMDDTRASSPENNTALSTNNWQHVTVTFKGTDDSHEAKFYLNGEPDGSGTAYDGNGSSSQTNLYLGWQSRSGQGADSYYNGKMDNVRIYNRAFSPKEVRDLYNWAPGPIAYYKMDEGSGTSSIYDSSGNQNTGTMNNMAEDNWISGKFGSALNFSGSNQRITLNSPVSSTGHTTVSVWYKRDENSAADNWRTLLGHATDNIHHLIIHSTSRNLGIFDGTFRDFGYTPPDDGKWHHFAVVYDNSNNATLYVDGKYQNQITTTLDLSSDPIGSIGNWNSGNYFAGPIDNVQIYKYARTPSQIVENMNAGHPVGGSPISSKLLHFNFDEGYGTTAYDSGTNGDNGTLTDGPTWTNSGKFNKALSLDGTNDRVQELTAGPFEYTGGDLTLSTWLKPNSSDSDGGGVISKPWNGSGEYNYLIELDSSNKVYLKLYDGDTDLTTTVLTSNSSLTTDQWNHISATLDGDTSTASIYINGQLDNSSTHSITNWTPVSGDSNKSLLVGCIYPYGSGWAGNTGHCIQGEFDEVKIYNAPLTADQVKHDMNQGASTVLGATSTDSSGNASFSSERSYCPPGDTTANCAPVAEWKFDEKSGTDAQDTSGDGYTGTLTNMETSDWKTAAECHSGSCLNFDGSDEYVSLSGDSFYPTCYTSCEDPRTITAWIKTNNHTQESAIVGRFDSDGSSHWDNYGSGLKYINGSISVMGRNNGDNALLSHDISDNNWHHVVGITNTSNGKLYIDGNLVDSGDLSSGYSYDFCIGAQCNDGNSHNFDGIIDQLKIYDYALSQEQIAWNYNRGKPVGHWKLDSCQGTTAYDSSGNGNNGTITIGGTGTNTSAGTCSGSSGEAWADGSTGKLNASLEFDGTDDYIDAGTTGIYDSPNFSVFTWIDGTDQSGNTRIVNFGDTNNNYGGFIIGQNDSGGMRTYIDTGTGNWDGLHPSANLNDSNWHHIGMTYDGTNRKVYIDGVEVASDQPSSYTDTPSDAVTTIGSSTHNTEEHEGKIDDVQIFNYALTDQQIKNLYNQSAIRFGPSFGSP